MEDMLLLWQQKTADALGLTSDLLDIEDEISLVSSDIRFSGQTSVKVNAMLRYFGVLYDYIIIPELSYELLVIYNHVRANPFGL